MQVSTDLHVWLSKKRKNTKGITLFVDNLIDMISESESRSRLHNKAFDPDIIDISKAEYYINIKIHSLELRLWILLI